MKNKCVTREMLVEFLKRLDAVFARPATLYLIGETTQVFEGMRKWTNQVEFTTDVESRSKKKFARAVLEIGDAAEVTVLDESPGDLVPLPDGFEARARDARGFGDALFLNHLTIRHFDPYSVTYRFIARGDESDYHLVLTFLENGWVEFDKLDTMLEALLPRFGMETIQQDPAEFRRKYKSLDQMWRSTRPHATHRVTVV